MIQPPDASTLALDVGEKRIGLALASAGAQLAQPLTTLQNDDSFAAKLQEIIEKEQVRTLVVGLPRGMEGQETAQTAYVRTFTQRLKVHGLPILFQDEAATSVHAEQELRNRGVRYTKEDVDALSATYILEDYLREKRNG